MHASPDSSGCNGLPELSVILAVHNGQAFVREAVASVLNQSFQDFEFIIVDDASTDATSGLLREVADQRLRVITLDRNVGLVDALNRALLEARGGLIARMDADDIARPQRFAAQVARMESAPDLVLLGTAFDFIDGQGRILRHQSVSTDNETLQRRLIEECNQFCHPSVMLRADAVRKVGGYRKLTGRFAQDYDLWLRLAEVGKVANLPEALVGYRVHKEQLSVKKLFPQRRSAEIYKELARQRRACGREDLEAAVRAADSRRGEVKRAVADDYLRWAEMFALMGDKPRSRMMLLRAFLVAGRIPAVFGGRR